MNRSRHLGRLMRLVIAVLPALLPVVAGAAGPAFWDYPETVPFDRCDLLGVGVDEYGRLAPGLRADTQGLDGPEIVWGLVPDGEGGAWAGTGHDGEVWRFPRDGAPRKVASLAEPELFAIEQAGDALYVGGGPDGLIFRVGKDGASETWADLPEQYVWALAVASDGKLYAAAGSPATVYRIDGRLSVTKLAELPAANAMDLAVAGPGRLLVATQGPGLVWEIDPARQPSARVVYETPQDEVRQIAAGPDGAWYALAISQGGGARDLGASLASEATEPVTVLADSEAGSPGKESGQRAARGGPGPEQPDVGIVVVASAEPSRAALYRLGADGEVSLAWAGEAGVVAVAHTARWGWVGAGVRDQTRSLHALWALDASGAARPLATWEGGDPVRLLAAPDGAGGPRLWVAQARPARVTRLSDRPAEAAVAIAPPIEGKTTLRWGRLHWEGETPEGAKVRFAVRGGSRAAPDQTWSAWSETWSEVDHAIPLPPSRFLQWRVEFSGASAAARVGAVTVSAYEPNGAPRVARFDLQPPGEIAQGNPLEEGGNVTELFASGLRAEYNVGSRRDRRADPLAASRVRPVRSFTWQAWDPNDDRLVYTLAYRRLAEEAWRPIGDETRETVMGWDTAGVPDGLYVLRLTVSDRPSNPPDQALTGERLSTPLLVDNTPPTIVGFQLKRGGSGLKATARVADAASPLSEAWLELPDGRTVRLDPTDGICDSREEAFDAQVTFPAAGALAPPLPWHVKAGFVDRAGNVGRAEGETR